jgi:hypothetical protein
MTLKVGAVFKIMSKLYVCVRVNDCSARVVRTSMSEVNDDTKLYDEFDPAGVRISANPEIDQLICVLPRHRIKFRESAYRPPKPREVGVVTLPVATKKSATKRAEPAEPIAPAEPTEPAIITPFEPAAISVELAEATAGIEKTVAQAAPPAPNPVLTVLARAAGELASLLRSNLQVLPPGGLPRSQSS